MKRLLFCLVAIFVSLTALAQKEIVVDAQPPAYLKFQHPPFVLDGYTMVPLREVCEAFGISIDLDTDSIYLIGEINGDKIDAEISLKSDPSDIADAADRARFLQRLPEKGNIVTFVPARLIEELIRLPITKDGNLLTIGGATWQVEGKLIVIDLSKQKVNAFEGLKQVYECRTCTGAYDPKNNKYPTPIGIFETYMRSPGKFVGRFGPMYWPTFFNGSVALHNCPSDRNVKKTPDSHGCCRLKRNDRIWLWDWIPGKMPSSVKEGKLWYIPKIDRIPVYVIP